MDRQPTRPDYNEVRDLLKSYQGLIVHFSTSPPMHAEQDGHYPSDLHTAITSPHCRGGGLSCSIVTPYDPFTGDSRFVPGYIGIILDPTGGRSIVSCSTADGGDCRIPGTYTVMSEREGTDMSIDDLEITISERTTYNNWLVRDYEVCGILAIPPFTVEVMHSNEYMGRVRAPKNTSIIEVAAEFPCQAVYTIEGHQHYKLNATGDCDAISYEEIWQKRIPIQPDQHQYPVVS